MSRISRALIPVITVIALAATACGQGTAAPTSPPTPAPEPPCALEPIVPPPVPDTMPGQAQLDPTTGLHVTGRPREVDLSTWRLEITGEVEQPLSLSYDELRCLSRVDEQVTLVCPGFFVDEARWAGAPLAEVLDRAGLRPGASEIRLVGLDGYSDHVPLTEEVLRSGFLAYEWEGEPVPFLHGFPVRAVFPGEEGHTWVKWLIRIEVG